MKANKAILHAIEWAMHHMNETHQEALGIIKDDKLKEEEKVKLLTGTKGPDYRLVNLILLFKPMLEIARKEYPEQEKMFKWVEECWQDINDNDKILRPCGCKGCKDDIAKKA